MENIMTAVLSSYKGQGNTRLVPTSGGSFLVAAAAVLGGPGPPAALARIEHCA